MKVTQFTRSALAYRREERDMLARGWEAVSEGGGRLWEIHRGWRSGHRIVDCKIGVCGRRLWVKIEATP